MTNKQATDISAQASGTEVREHPKCEGGENPWYYAVGVRKSAPGGTVDKVRAACVTAGIGYCIETAPAWASDCAAAIY